MALVPDSIIGSFGEFTRLAILDSGATSRFAQNSKNQKCSRLFLVSIEGLVTVWSLHRELTITFILDAASVNELLHQVGCSLTSCLTLLHHPYLFLENFILVQFGSSLLLLENLGFLVCLDLGLSPSALTTRLQKVR